MRLWKWKKVLWHYHWYHRPHSLILPKFRNTIKKKQKKTKQNKKNKKKKQQLGFTCSIVFTTLSNQILNLCSCNHWNWSVVARLVCVNLTSQLWLRFSDVFNFLYLFIYFFYIFLIEHCESRTFKQSFIYFFSYFRFCNPF